MLGASRAGVLIAALVVLSCARAEGIPVSGSGFDISVAEGATASLVPGATLRTGASGAARFALASSSTISLGAESELRLEQLDSTGAVLALARGTVDAEAEPDVRIEVRAPGGVAVGSGARFTLIILRGTSRAEVAVNAGAVEISGAGRSLVVPAGRTGILAAGLQPYLEGAAAAVLAVSGGEPPLEIAEATYGLLALRSVPGAECLAGLSVPTYRYGDLPPSSFAGRADASGIARLSYPAPRIPGGLLSYSVSCRDASGSATRSGSFEVAARSIDAATFTVRISAGPPRDLPRLEDPRLVALRERSIEELTRSLAREWSAATRGLSALVLVEAGPDIVISVVAGSGTSVHRTGADGSEDIVVYVADPLGDQTVENVVATALHELGHNWCCYGPDATGGHWVSKLESPGLFGLDRYGLMNHPVTCSVLTSGALSCPNRLSDRELQAMGFTAFPPPPPSPCGGVAAMKSRHDAIARRVAELEPEIRRSEARIAALAAEIEAIEARNPLGIPPSLWNGYRALVDEHNSLLRQRNAQLVEYNALADEGNALRERLLPLEYCLLR